MSERKPFEMRDYTQMGVNATRAAENISRGLCVLKGAELDEDFAEAYDALNEGILEALLWLTDHMTRSFWK